MEGLLAGLEASGVAGEMRRSVWLYPLANVVHVTGLMLFFASVAAMDIVAMRERSVSAIRSFVARVRPLAVLFLLVQIGTGVMLFLPEAGHIAVNPVFQVKVLAILLALGNVVWLERMLRGASLGAVPTLQMRLAAGVSLLLWLGVAALGRLIAYF
ncbi:hypothetical protein RNZ50_06130 [Paracoccaceae bacterium Fryx2]|nr:hypothetical protein [Paracoccaceae bacterium Fryx2]